MAKRSDSTFDDEDCVFVDLEFLDSSLRGSNTMQQSTSRANDPQTSTKDSSLPTVGVLVPVERSLLGEEEFRKFFDGAGRLVNEHEFRRRVFRGGISSKIRREAWRYLFKIYPCHSTKRERTILRLDLFMKYKALKEKWLNLSKENSPDPDVVYAAPSSPKPLDFFHESGMTEEEATHQLHFLKLQAEVHAGRLTISSQQLSSTLRAIDKDVPRTERELEFFKGDDNPNLTKLRNILVTFAVTHPDLGYAQGMNDLASRFLIVFNEEVDAYWSFANFIHNVGKNFMEEGIISKLETLSALLKKLDSNLFEHIERCGVGDLMFCHRWMLLWFQREFSLEDGLEIFEVLSSRHLEMNSFEAIRAKDAGCRESFKKEGGRLRLVAVESEPVLTFEQFVCISVLMDNRQQILQCDDVETVFRCVFQLLRKSSVRKIICRAEELFFNYCRKTADDCFQVIDFPSP